MTSTIRSAAEFDGEIDLASLRTRTSEKWRRYPASVLPLFVAETDFPVAPNVARALHDAVDRGDLGYAVESAALGEAYAGFARARYGLSLRPEDVLAVPEVMVGVAEILRAITSPDEGVVINPPVYRPFFLTIREVGRRIVEVPLAATGTRYELDFDALEAAFQAGARVFLFCNPHNPVGRVYSAGEVERVAELAARYDVAVLADEIHAPLVLPGAVHTPFESVVESSGAKAITLTSASKGWNIAGLKCALAITTSEWGRSVFARLPKEMTERSGILGTIATIAAFGEDVAYLDRVVAHLDTQRKTLRELLDSNGFESVRYTAPEASFLAWLDCRALDLGMDPAAVFLKKGRVALNPGRHFGKEGAGFVRVNFATSTSILEEAVARMRTAILSA